MHPAHFPAQQMSLNVFCSCGPSGEPIQINLPDHLCLLDKTWHIGLYSPAAFNQKILLPNEISDAYHRLSFQQLWQNSCPLIKPVPKPFKNWGYFFLNKNNFFFFGFHNALSWSLARDNERVFHKRKLYFLSSEIWIHAPVSPPPTLRRSSLFFSLFFCLLSSP